jgi:hypothetical protein
MQHEAIQAYWRPPEDERSQEVGLLKTYATISHNVSKNLNRRLHNSISGRLGISDWVPGSVESA